MRYITAQELEKLEHLARHEGEKELAQKYAREYLELQAEYNKD